jgi:hypothetical protein
LVMPCASPPLRALAETLHAVPCRTGPHVHAASKSGQVWVRGLELVDSLRSVLLDPCVRDAMCVAAIAGIGGNAPRGSLPDWTPRPCCVKKRTGLGSRPGPPPPEGGGENANKTDRLRFEAIHTENRGSPRKLPKLQSPMSGDLDYRFHHSGSSRHPRWIERRGGWIGEALP